MKTLTSKVQKRIRAGKDRNNRPFEKLSPFTIRKRSEKSLHSSTTPDKSNLTQTGAMVDDTVIQVTGPGKMEMTVKSSSRSKAKEHMRGKNTEGRPIPVRPFFGLTRDEKRHLRKLVRDALVKRLR